MELLTQPTAAEALEAGIEHALSMRAAFHEMICGTTAPPDKLQALLDLENAWLAKAKRLEARRRSLVQPSMPAA